MPKNILITGYPGVGKTTFINKITKQLSCKIAGFYTHEMMEQGRRTGFYITDFEGNQMVMASEKSDSPYRVNKYGLNIDAFEKIGIPALEQALTNADLIVIDEIGRMEMFSQTFCDKLRQVFDSDKPLLATIKRIDCELTKELKAREDVQIFEVTQFNRDTIFDKVINKLGKVL
ncbi:MAG: NTPase [Candidatus Cloacimonetes bacterium]|nr:NTPase [Candidatus Cloacimonadota bacterium]